MEMIEKKGKPRSGGLEGKPSTSRTTNDVTIEVCALWEEAHTRMKKENLEHTLNYDAEGNLLFHVVKKGKTKYQGNLKGLKKFLKLE